MYKNVFFEICGKCNALCNWCSTGRANRYRESFSAGYMSPADIDRALIHMTENRIISPETIFHLYNFGEPFLHPHFSNVLDQFCNYNIRYTLSTNGSVLRDISAKQAVMLEQIVFSMPGFSQQSYDKMHGISFSTVKSNIKSLMEKIRANGFVGKAQISFHVYQHNLNEIDEAIKFAIDQKISISPYYAYFNGLKLYQEYAESKLNYEQLKMASQELMLFYIDAHKNQRPDEYLCPQIDEILAIDDKFNVLPCCGYEKRMDIYSLGNLFNMTLEEIQHKKSCHKFCLKCKELRLDFLINNPYTVKHHRNQLEITQSEEAPTELEHRISIDSPVDGQNIESTQLLIHGWCLSGQPVGGIDILIDNKFVGKANCGIFRPDVYNTYPDYQNYYSGYMLQLDVVDLEEGQHELQVLVFDRMRSQVLISSKVMWCVQKEII